MKEEYGAGSVPRTNRYGSATLVRTQKTHYGRFWIPKETKLFVLILIGTRIKSDILYLHWIFNECFGLGMFIPDPNFFHPGSALKNLSILAQKIVSKLSEIWSGLFIPDPDHDFSPSLIQGSKRHRILDPDPQHCFQLIKYVTVPVYPLDGLIFLVESGTDPIWTASTTLLLNEKFRGPDNFDVDSTLLCRWLQLAQLAKGKKSRP